MSEPVKFWAVIPAAGSSRRMGPATLPKQYLELAGRCVLAWSLEPFLAHPQCSGVVVVLAADDAQWPALEVAKDSRIATAAGGAERSQSVQRGLEALGDRAAADDWVLVHDAARPCLDRSDLDELLQQLGSDPVGGLLAAPVIDTLKRADTERRVLNTVERENLWRALTPQMFRYGLLKRALTEAQRNTAAVTDEAQAVELLGLNPKLVAGSADNIKITVPQDLARAQQILASRSRQYR